MYIFIPEKILKSVHIGSVTASRTCMQDQTKDGKTIH